MNYFTIFFEDHRHVSAIAIIAGVSITCDGGVLGKLLSPADAMKRFLALQKIVPSLTIERKFK